jgi:hypothetical protein
LKQKRKRVGGGYEKKEMKRKCPAKMEVVVVARWEMKRELRE